MALHSMWEGRLWAQAVILGAVGSRAAQGPRPPLRRQACLFWGRDSTPDHTTDKCPERSPSWVTFFFKPRFGVTSVQPFCFVSSSRLTSVRDAVGTVFIHRGSGTQPSCSTGPSHASRPPRCRAVTCVTSRLSLLPTATLLHAWLVRDGQFCVLWGVVCF